MKNVKRRKKMLRDVNEKKVDDEDVKRRKKRRMKRATLFGCTRRTRNLSP